jgi:hypothetical protein
LTSAPGLGNYARSAGSQLLSGAAHHHQFTGAKRAAALAKLAEVADGRVDRLAEEAGLLPLPQAECQ